MTSEFWGGEIPFEEKSILRGEEEEESIDWEENEGKVWEIDIRERKNPKFEKTKSVHED